MNIRHPDRTKFPLRIDGTTVKSTEELKRHFTSEVLGLFKTGILVRWLRGIGDHDRADRLKSIDTSNNYVILKALCAEFEVKAPDSVLEYIAEFGNLEVNEDEDSDDTLHKSRDNFLDQLTRALVGEERGEDLDFDDYEKKSEKLLRKSVNRINQGYMLLMKAVNKLETGKESNFVPIMLEIECFLCLSDLNVAVGDRVIKNQNICRGSERLTVPCDGYIHEFCLLGKKPSSFIVGDVVGYIRLEDSEIKIV